MSEETKQWLLRNAKVLTVCAAMLYLANGLNTITTAADTRLETVEITETAEETEEPTEVSTEVLEEEVESSSAGLFSWSDEERYMLAKIAMAEAESEDTEGKALVMLVVLNRVQSSEFPGTIEGVIYQENQFSPVNEGGRWYSVEPDQDCWDALALVESGWDESQDALYFESRSASKWHEQNLKFLFQHGSHYFYTEKEE